MPSSSCLLCRGPAESSTRDGRLSVCRKCCRNVVLPLVVDALGEDEAARAVADLAEPRGGGARPMVPPRLRSLAEMSLSQSAARVRRTARVEGRGLSSAELSLSLAATRAAQERLTLARAAARQPSHANAKAAARQMCRRLGLDGGNAAELSTIGTATTTATTPRPTRQLKRVAQESLPMSRDGIKAALRKLVERAGMQATAG